MTTTNHEHDYRCVFSCHIGLTTVSGLTKRQRNPWSYVTMSESAFKASLVKELIKAGRMEGLVKTETGYTSEHLLDRKDVA